MGRGAHDTLLHTRAARARLKVRPTPYWRLIEDGRHIGYYRGTLKSTWVARLRVKTETLEAAYRTYRIGLCDDLEEADGERILNWTQAKLKAEAWFEAQRRAGPKHKVSARATKAVDAPVFADAPTVADIIHSYIAMRDARHRSRAGRDEKSDAHRIKLHVLERSGLGPTNLSALSESDLRTWRSGLEGLKKSSRTRTVNDFKAALNDAHRRYRKLLPPDFATVIKVGLEADGSVADDAEEVARENQILSDDQVSKIVTKAVALDSDGDRARMTILLAATGARFSQVRRMLVKDVQAIHSRLMIPVSRKGKGKTATHLRVQVGADVLEALRPIIEGRAPNEPLLERWRLVQTGPATWRKQSRGPWQAASELTRFWKMVVADVGLAGTVPYALRHSSIVRGIRVGLPIRLVAALHDTSVAMIERHYSRWITEGLDELASRAVVPLLSPSKPVASGWCSDGALNSAESEVASDSISERPTEALVDVVDQKIMGAAA